MQQVKVAIWGITSSIWKSIKNTIDPRKTEICFFVDKNANMSSEFKERYQIYSSIDQVSEKKTEVDYFLIAAYSGYAEIRETLLSQGICEEKIQIYITPGLVSYDLGDLSQTKKELVERIYFEPSKRWEDVTNYREDYAKYKNGEVKATKRESWYECGTLISHACGGIVNGERIKYSNSKEALHYSFEQGFQLIECDVLLAGKEVVLAHDYYRFYEALEKKYTLQNFSDMLRELVNYPYCHMLVDVKWNLIEEYKYFVYEIKQAIEEIVSSEAEKKHLMRQIIMEAYDEETICCAQEQGFDVFFTLYRNEEIRNFLKIATICVNYQIGAVGYDVNFISKYSHGIKVLKQKGIKIFAYSTDSTQECKELRRIGVDGFFTNFLTYDSI